MGEAHAGAQAEGALGQLDGVLDALGQACRRGSRAPRGRRMRGHHHELVAPVARHEVALAHRRLAGAPPPGAGSRRRRPGRSSSLMGRKPSRSRNTTAVVGLPRHRSTWARSVTRLARPVRGSKVVSSSRASRVARSWVMSWPDTTRPAHGGVVEQVHDAQLEGHGLVCRRGAAARPRRRWGTGCHDGHVDGAGQGRRQAAAVVRRRELDERPCPRRAPGRARAAA